MHEYARALEESSDEEDEPVYEGAESRLSGKQGTEPCLDDHDTVTEAPTEVSATPAERADSVRGSFSIFCLFLAKKGGYLFDGW